MFGWFSHEASCASRMNISTNDGSLARNARIRLITTSFSNPSGPCEAQRKISAIPPAAIFRLTTYLPTGVPAESVTEGAWRLELHEDLLGLVGLHFDGL